MRQLVLSVILKISLVCIAPVALPNAAMAQRSKQSDDYVACLIGRAAVALQAQTQTKDAAKAQTVAYKLCKPHGKIDDEEGEGISDFVNIMVTKMAHSDCN